MHDPGRTGSHSPSLLARIFTIIATTVLLACAVAFSIVVFAVALTASMGGLAYAMRTLPTGTAYAIWVGIGASLTVAYAMATGAESTSIVKILLILGIG